MTAGPRTYLGHDPSADVPGYEGRGTDFLLTVFPAEDDHPERLELATRPGHEERWLTWGIPVDMAATP